MYQSTFLTNGTTKRKRHPWKLRYNGVVMPSKFQVKNLTIGRRNRWSRKAKSV